MPAQEDEPLAYNTWARSLLELPAMSLSLPTHRHALFLDFDGTLADIAACPQAVRVQPEVIEDLRRLHGALQGALAIITGRTEADVDHFLAPLRLPLACEHGAHYRLDDGGRSGVPALALDSVIDALRPLMEQHPELLLESKNTGLAVHFRRAPQLEAACLRVMTQALDQVPGAELIRGKCVLEVKAEGTSKGRAIEIFMRRLPFAGRIPMFIGDDVTDESGFAAAQALGGVGVKVGDGPTQACVRLESPAEVRSWLQNAVEAFTKRSPQLAGKGEL